MNILTSYHPALLALQSLHDQFPGALNFYLFCNDNGTQAYHSNGKNKGIFLPTNMETAESRPRIQKFRVAKKEVYWGDSDDLPVKPQKKSGKSLEIKQLSIQDEIEQNVLIFRVPSLNDDSNDTFAIHFSKTFSNFYIPSGRNVLSSEMKQSIGKTIRNQILWLYDLHEKQTRNIGRIQHAYLQSADDLEVAQAALEQEKATNRNLLEKYLNQLIREQEISLNCKIVVKNGFLDKIKHSEIPIETIKEMVNNAVLTAFDLAIEKSIIQLTPNLLHLGPTVRSQPQKSVQLIELDKTQALLDRYEHAARGLEQKSMRVNGRNLAKELNISGPAITDAIKKHRQKIKRLLEKYPSRWVLICDFIRPIREIKLDVLSTG